ncbi:MAG: hypothetical protein LBU88_01000 [Treponema sp.]|jgi:hypothetical protein|nr:hypothetical protein [Treponema sp.]
MKYRVFITILLLSITVAVFAQVDRGELENLPPVVFINYEGPYHRIDTREQIRQLGVVLGRQIAERERGMEPTLANMSTEQRRAHSYRFEVGALNRYFIIHSVSAPEGSKFDADIFGLGVDTGVDHVRNLRWIIQGYLQEAYNYSQNDAALLAEYITIYNAVYRGSWDFFAERYKTPVISHLIRDRAGLSIRYDEWPGRTMMLIPLGHGGLSSIDTSAISDRRVIEELRREEDQGVPQRQGMVDLMERQAEEAEQRAQTQRESIRDQESQIAQDRQQTEQQRQQVAEERRQTQEDREAGRITEEQAREQEQEQDQRDSELAQRDQQTEERDRALDQQRDEAQRMEDYAERQFDSAQQQREEIARDQQAAIVQETTDSIFGVTLEKTTPTQMGRIVRLNPETGSEQRRSPLDTVHIRTVTFVSGRLIAIAGENRGNRAVRLIELNQTNLEMARQGEDDIRPGSLLWVNGSDLYAITIDLRSNQCFLGRFDTGLTLQAKSAVRIHPEASVTIQQGRLLTQRENGAPLLLNPMDLTELGSR